MVNKRSFSQWSEEVTIRHSFSARLSLYVVLMTSLVFIAASVIFFLFSKRIVKQEAVRHANSELSATVHQIEDVLHWVQVAAENMEWAVEQNLSRPDSLYHLTRLMIRNNPMIIGSSIAFEPFYYPEKGKMFAPYSYVDNDNIIKDRQLGTLAYNYHEKDWYKTAKFQNRHYWSEPYFDEGGADSIIATYSHLLRDKNGKMYGILTADISLRHLAELVSRIHPYPSSYNMMVSHTGTYLVHPKQERILHETVFSATADMEDRTVFELGDAMMRGEEGMRELQNDDTLSYVFFKPIHEAGWSVAVVCPHRDVFSSLDSITFVIITVFIVGLFLLLVFCVMIIRRTSRPLRQFSEAVVRIAEGELDVALPDIRTKDELAHFRDSFAYMQHSLKDYIRQLTETTRSKERIESELHIARQIQMSMIPKIFSPFPEWENLELYAYLQPAKEVGGDFYDFFIRDRKLFFTVGDVSGKGIPASLVMAITRSLFRIMAGSYDSPARIASLLNHAIAEQNETNMFITMYIGVLNLDDGKLVFCNGGHNPPLLIQPGGGCDFQQVKPNLPIGIMDNFLFEEQETYIGSGTSLLLYTDGLTEAENIAHEQLGEKEVMQKAAGCCHLPVQEIVARIRQQVIDFAGEAEQSDDLTLLCLRLDKISTKKE